MNGLVTTGVSTQVMQSLIKTVRGSGYVFAAAAMETLHDIYIHPADDLERPRFVLAILELAFLNAWLTLPSWLASSKSATLARVIFCSVVLVFFSSPCLLASTFMENITQKLIVWWYTGWYPHPTEWQFANRIEWQFANHLFLADQRVLHRKIPCPHS